MAATLQRCIFAILPPNLRTLSVSAVSRGRTDIPEDRAGESWGAGGRPSLFEECHKDRGWAFLRKRTHQELPVLGRVKHPNSPLEFFFSLLRSFQSSKNVVASKELDNTRQFAVGELLIIIGGQMPSWGNSAHFELTGCSNCLRAVGTNSNALKMESKTISAPKSLCLHLMVVISGVMIITLITSSKF